jgi:Ni/Co efflux regulator RcnB
MNKSLFLALPLLAAFAAAPAIAKDKHHDRNHGTNARHHDRDYDSRHDGRHDGRHDNGNHNGWRNQRWRRGDRIEVVYIQPTYYVDDYRRYELREPPRGYRWVQPMDDRYLLVELTTGLIIEALGY